MRQARVILSRWKALRTGTSLARRANAILQAKGIEAGVGALAGRLALVRWRIGIRETELGVLLPIPAGERCSQAVAANQSWSQV
jgi:hypothetical protein